MAVLSCREWYANGDYLVLLVSLVIILPLSLLRNLGRSRSLRVNRAAGSGALTSLSSSGYLGYTSGLSLLCMVFFLIVVSITLPGFMPASPQWIEF